MIDISSIIKSTQASCWAYSSHQKPKKTKQKAKSKIGPSISRYSPRRPIFSLVGTLTKE